MKQNTVMSDFTSVTLAVACVIDANRRQHASLLTSCLELVIILVGNPVEKWLVKKVGYLSGV
jgi:multisubunit Na+/H+ antiporter MnhG subunit